MVTHTSGAVVAPKERRLLLRLHMSISHACILCGAQSEHVAAAGSAAQRTAGQVSSCPPAGAAHCHRILSADAGPHSTGSRHPTVARAPDNECASTCPHLQVRLISHRVLPALGVEEGGGEEGGGLRRRGVSKGGGAQTCSRRVLTCLGFHLVRHWELAVLSPTHNVASDQSASSKTSAGQASPPPCSPLANHSFHKSNVASIDTSSQISAGQRPHLHLVLHQQRLQLGHAANPHLQAGGRAGASQSSANYPASAGSAQLTGWLGSGAVPLQAWLKAVCCRPSPQTGKACRPSVPAARGGVGGRQPAVHGPHTRQLHHPCLT